MPTDQIAIQNLAFSSFIGFYEQCFLFVCCFFSLQNVGIFSLLLMTFYLRICTKNT